MQDDGLMRRLKALAVTAPLHDLDTRKSRLEFANADGYQMSEIAFHVIDQVTLAMDFDRGAGHEQVVRDAAPFVAAQAPDRPAEEHRRITEWVLNELLNVGSQDRGFSAWYGSYDADGAYVKRQWTFKLLVEYFDQDGDIYLRSTDEAINVLVGALDMDVESAQEAAETKLANLIKRGRLSDAKTAADQALRLTIRLGERLREKLDATRRDVRRVDWTDEMPRLITEAVDHVGDRMRQESAILENLTQTRDNADDLSSKRMAAELVDLVGSCMARHNQLQARLQTAGSTFRAEQDRQEFSGVVFRDTYDVFGQILTPVLGLPVVQAQDPAVTFFRSVAGLKVPPVTRLLDLVFLLLSPPVERDDLGTELPVLDLAEAIDPDVFTPELFAQAEHLLDLGGVPRRLSSLLVEARSIDATLAHLVGLMATQSLDPGVMTAVAQGDPTVVLAIDDGTALIDDEFGGADLLVGLAYISPPSEVSVHESEGGSDGSLGTTRDVDTTDVLAEVM